MRDGEQNTPVLTILIPSYNRGARVRVLVQYLIPVIRSLRGLAKLVVSNNCSSDDTEHSLQFLNMEPNCRLINRSIHLGTTEEHIFHAVEAVDTEYVWFLGDDDIPNTKTVEFLVFELAKGTHDVLFFNSIVVDVNGGATGGWIAPMDTDMSQADFTDGACFLGYTFCFAGISNIVQRTAPLKEADWREALSKQTIYSHVAWWLLAFKGYRLTFVNRVLVHYRMDDGATISQKFRKYAEKISVPDFHFWTSGLISQLMLLETRGAISPRHVREMYELRGDGSHYRFLDNIVYLICSQVVLSVTESAAAGRNHLSSVQLAEMTDWVLKMDPGFFECFEIVNDIYALQYEPDSVEASRYKPSRYALAVRDSNKDARVRRLRERFDDLRLYKIATTNVLIGMVSRYLDYVVYSHISGFVAFDEERPLDRQAILRRVDIRPKTDAVVTGASEEDIRNRIRSARERQFIDRQQDKLSGIAVELAMLRETLATQGPPSIPHQSHQAEQSRNLQPPQGAPSFQRIAKRVRRVIMARTFAPRYFDRSWYLEAYPDVAVSGFDAYEHFIKHGLSEGRNPNPMFDADWYTNEYSDIQVAGLPAFTHFMQFGRNEGRRPHPKYNVDEFERRYPAS